MSDRVARIFCSYSHRDDEYREELENHLGALKRLNLIEFWYDRRIGPGDEWRKELAVQLEEADIILLLVSAYFISSDYCYKIELGRALQRHDEGSAVVIPIFVRTCDWEGLEFTRLQGLPPDCVPVNDYDDRDKAWVLVARGIRKARTDLFARKPKPPIVASLSEASCAEINSYEFHAYLRHLLISYEREPWAANAIPISSEIEGCVIPVEDAIESWVNRVGDRLFLLTGEPGSGKTCAFRQFAATLADKILGGNSRTPQPLFVPFHSIRGSNAISAISMAVPQAKAALEHLSRGVSTIVFLDGLDEFFAQSSQEGVNILIDLLKTTAKSVRIAVSCRSLVANDVVGSLRKAGFDPTLCAIQEISTQQVNRYLKQSGFAAINNALTTQTIQKPILLRLFKEIPLVNFGVTPSLYEIYVTATNAWLKSARERDRQIADIPEEVLFTFMASLAGQMFPHLTISVSEVQIDDQWKTRKLDIINGLAATGLITLDARELIAFTHASLFEFFYAQLIYDEIMDWNAQHLARSNLIYSYTINRFLIQRLLRNDNYSELTPKGLSVRKCLECDVTSVLDRSISNSIQRKDFLSFIADTKWRCNTGFGTWTKFSGADGTPACSDGCILPEASDIVRNECCQTDDAPAISLSWYDAFQFTRWIGGHLPLMSELHNVSTNNAPVMEWTDDWFDESKALMSVIEVANGNRIGVNPDVRSQKIGFRVRL